MLKKALCTENQHQIIPYSKNHCPCVTLIVPGDLAAFRVMWRQAKRLDFKVTFTLVHPHSFLDTILGHNSAENPHIVLCGDQVGLRADTAHIAEQAADIINAARAKSSNWVAMPKDAPSSLAVPTGTSCVGVTYFRIPSSLKVDTPVDGSLLHSLRDMVH